MHDQRGAVVPGATVVVKNQASGDERKTITGHSGDFAVTALHAGTYEVIATANGFSTETVTDIALHAEDNKSVDIALSVGTVTASVTVSAQTDTSIVEEDSGAKSETISGSDLQNMTMASRNAAEVVKLMSGAMLQANGGQNKSGTTTIIGMNTFTPSGTAAGLGGSLVNGQSVDLTMDGSHDFDPGSAGANTPVNPNMDMISELKVLSSSFSAEYEHGPVVINVETKGGGSQYHGQVHFYAQNEALNANDSTFNTQNVSVGNTYQYYPGAQISGPVPSIFGFNKQKNKLFFFDGFEKYIQHLAPGLDEAVVPTADMYNGNFSPNAASNQNLKAVGNLNPYINASGNAENIPVFNSSAAYAPYLNACSITGQGVMSSGCIDPTGLKLLQEYFGVTKVGMVDPAAHKGYNYVYNTTTDFNQWQNVARVDWSISDNTKVYVRINTSRESDTNPNGVWGSSVGQETVPAPTPDVANNTADDIAFALTKVFSPTLTNETTFAWSKVKMPNVPQDASKVSRSAAGLPETVFGQDVIPSYGNWSTNFPGLGPGGNYLRSPLNMMANKLMPSARSNITKVLGAHTLKAGAYYEYIANKQDTYGSFNGWLSMPEGWGQDVNNNYATMLMGIDPAGYSEEQPTPPLGEATYQARFFVNDHFKASRRLTIDMGVRFDHFQRPYSTNKYGLAVWDASRYNDDASTLNAHTGVYWNSLDSKYPKSGVTSTFLFYSPRFGLAYDVFGKGKTILRGGLGTFYAYDGIAAAAYFTANQTAFGQANVSCGTGQCPVWSTISSTNNVAGSSGGSLSLKEISTHALGAGLAAGLQNVNVINIHDHDQPYVFTYNLQVDQLLPWKVMVEASYVGNHGDGNQGQADHNAIKPGSISSAYNLYCATNGGTVKGTNGQLLNATGQACDYNAGFNAGALPTSSSTGHGWRPAQNYEQINENFVSGKSQYDGLQLSAHRSTGILFLITNFTWAKTYSVTETAPSLADFGTSEYWGVAPSNRKFTFNASYTVSEPKINVSNPVLRKAVNDWQISGVTQLSSSANMTASSGGNLDYGWGNDTEVHCADGTLNGVKCTSSTVTTATHDNVAAIGANQATLMATVICDPRMHKKIAPGTNSLLPDGGMQYLNPACFAPTTSGLGSTHNAYYPGPSFFNSDLAVVKSVKLNDRQNLQIKLQAFNFLNHPLWSFANGSNLDLQFQGQIKSDTGTGVEHVTQEGGVLNSASKAFGIADKDQRTGHRTIQLEARYFF